MTFFHEFEFVNAVQLKRFREEITDDEKELVVSKFGEHEKMGVYCRPTLDWAQNFNLALSLSKNFSSVLGSRSLDIIHVASALFLKADNFSTFDARQTEPARSADLEIDRHSVSESH